MASEHHLIKIAAPQFGCATGVFGNRTLYDSTTSCWSSNIGGYDWQCNYTTNSSRGTVSLTLLLPHGNIREPLNARFKFSLLDREGRQVPSSTRSSSFQNWSTQQRWEWICDDFITKEDLEQPEYRLDDGSFTVRGYRCDLPCSRRQHFPCAPVCARGAVPRVPGTALWWNEGEQAD
ncbi:unnamed protein product [Urochloa humidicola]